MKHSGVGSALEMSIPRVGERTEPTEVMAVNAAIPTEGTCKRASVSLGHKGVHTKVHSSKSIPAWGKASN